MCNSESSVTTAIVVKILLFLNFMSTHRRSSEVTKIMAQGGKDLDEDQISRQLEKFHIMDQSDDYMYVEISLIFTVCNQCKKYSVSSNVCHHSMLKH